MFVAHLQSTATLDPQMPHLSQQQDPVRALVTPSDNVEEGDDFNIFQFFADGPSARNSLTTTVSEDIRSKSVVTIAEGSIKASTSPRVVKRKLPKVEEEGEQTERWFSKVESML